MTACAVLGAGVFTSSAAHAAPVPRFLYQHANGTDEFEVLVGDRIVGRGQWIQDPVGDLPGDTLIAFDSVKDGSYIQADIDGLRIASTKGKNAPASDWKGGDIKEGVQHSFEVCIIGGGQNMCSLPVKVWS
ncbi:hypothetical protein AB0D12_11790 [Streptomyces sp. NPDC048479]|uniref:hypothetical protein n=1 Tax=Streptomyces sp. NPDC048479 TaxID=3154725 RepID=UPI00343FB0BF